MTGSTDMPLGGEEQMAPCASVAEDDQETMPVPALDECRQFLAFWTEITDTAHVTLVAIVPDGRTQTATFARSSLDDAAAWIECRQSRGENVYFQPNETAPGCSTKPSKSAMVAALCRGADIDPIDERGFGGERKRLHRMAKFLAADTEMPPTVIIDSGNGIQPLWVIAREVLSPAVIERVEAENREIEAAVGAAGTHNVDRLLRLPGTVNYPNAKKLGLGRRVSHARLLPQPKPISYTSVDAARLGAHLRAQLAGADLLPARTSAVDASAAERTCWYGDGKRDRSRAAMRIGADIRRDGGTFDDMVGALRTDPNTADWFAEKGQASEQRQLHRIWEKVAPRPSKSGKPVICLTAGRLDRIATAGETALLMSGSPVFQRGKALVRPVVTEVPAAHGRTTLAAGLDAITLHGMIDLLAQTAEWQSFDKRSGEWVDADPPAQVALVMLSRTGQWTFPRIAGVITTPTLRPDGTLLRMSGYDPATRLFHYEDTSLDLSTLSANPSRADAECALDLLNGLLREFPFVGPVDRAVALSGMITPVVRGAISVAPLHAAKASTAGTGKSFLVDVASAIATGRICPVASAGLTEEELEKRLTGLLLAGYPVASLDNVNGELGGDLLCQAVERPLVRVRPLGRSDIIELESRATLFATGNCLRVRGDMVRRTLMCTLDAEMERPELRQFTGNPVQTVLDDRGRYVAAALTVARAYQAAGCPGQLSPLASFEDWSGLVRSALVWLDCDDPCASMEAAREDDPELSELREVLSLWGACVGGGMENAQSVRSVVEQASTRKPSQMGEPPDFAYPDLHDALLRIAGGGGNIQTRRLGKWLADHEGRVVGGVKFKRHRTLAHGGAARWAAVR